MKIDLKNINWGEFLIEDLFKIYTGGDLVISRIKKGTLPIVSHSLENNGIAAWTAPIENRKLFDQSKTISLADRGNFYAYVQKYDFYIGTRVKALESNYDKINKYILQFICTAINKQSIKFSYGNNATGGTEKIRILLPKTDDGNPDYELMNLYIIEKEQDKISGYFNYISKRLKKLKKYKFVESLEKKEWKEFFLHDIFTAIQRGKRLKEEKHIKGKMPYIASSAYRNGVNNFVSNKERVRIFTRSLTLANSGSVGSCFYQPYTYVASDHVTKLENPKLNKSIMLFMSTVIARIGEKYSYNREISDERIKREKILLPVNESQEPDYIYMDNFMKRIEYTTLLKYKEYYKKSGFIKK
jgi:hypothetical protein